MVEQFYLLFLGVIVLGVSIRFILIYQYAEWRKNLQEKYQISEEVIQSLELKYNVQEKHFFIDLKGKLFSVFFLFIILGVTLYFFNHQYQIQQYGKKTTATVYQINSNATTSFALLEYHIDGKRYTTSIKLQGGKFLSHGKYFYYGKKHLEAKVGDQFIIEYSQQNPEISEQVSEYPMNR